jgi:putative ubiquitin-RnfH superfamily antitoxin RatB of RatAB toxin-antitoxin module
MVESSPREYVEVVYATADVQRIVRLPFETGMTAAQAVERAELAVEFPQILAAPLTLGIFGRPIDLEHRLEAGDRVEIARPLERDPRELRRELLRIGQVMGPAARGALDRDGG